MGVDAPPKVTALEPVGTPDWVMPKRITLRQRMAQLRLRFGDWTPEPGAVRWLFIATFPNGGSTALAELLQTASRATRVEYRAEGQWLVPQMYLKENRWNARADIDLSLIRKAWLREIARQDTSPCVVIEKSPPNMVRMREIMATFEDMPQTLVTFTRDPYAVCASWARRYNPERLENEWGEDTLGMEATSAEYFAELGRMYGRRAQFLIDLEDVAAARLSYEELTAQPALTLDRLAELEPMLADVDRDAKVKVKNYDPQPLENMNDRQIAALNGAQLGAITVGLKEYAEAIHALGYELR